MRTVIVGGPLRGKSTLARELRDRSGGDVPVYCSDPRSTVREPLDGVVYLPEGLPFRGDHGAAAYVAKAWLTLPGPWIIEGHAMARALARYLRLYPDMVPCDRVIALLGLPYGVETTSQRRLAKHCETQWRNVAGHAALRGRVQTRGVSLGR